jgi:RHS repeat-associated protein
LDNVDSTSPAIRSLGEGWFTGKPYVEGLGHAFWMRNYRAGLAKWQTADPIGYPDGWNQLAYCNNAATSAVDLWGCKEIVLLGEVDHSGYHVATVWAECNHNYNKPEFTIHVGQLKDHPDNKYVKASVDGITNIPATPNFSYVTTYAYTDADITHQVTLENFKLVVNVAVPVDALFNKIIMWKYQVEFDVKDEWEENSALNNKTRVEKQKNVSGRHFIEE